MPCKEEVSLLTRNSVELLAPVGTWDVLEAAVGAGADAVYLGGKKFNMRLHRTDANFDDEKLKRAVDYTHEHNVKLYITVNNLISDKEIAPMRDYLAYLEQIQPDALIIQDLAILALAKEMGLTVPLHSSVMLNTHNEHAVRFLQSHGVSRIVANREMSLSQLMLLKEKTGIEIEYFMHGDMCVAHSGQCIHSGVLFGQSSNRGRCLKACRWPYQLVYAADGQPVNPHDNDLYKLAFKDMCLYRSLPELIQSGVCSFKIEGRMRTADFVKNIVGVYRRAIDAYIADPTGYSINEEDWQNLYQGRARNFSTCYSFGNPGSSAVDYSGKREPRFFSQAVKEAGISVPPFAAAQPEAKPQTASPLSVRVADLASVKAASENGAALIYIGGEAFLPAKPWKLSEITEAIQTAHAHGSKVIVNTPRVAMERECGELAQFFTTLETIRPDGLMISNPGTLALARQYSTLPLYADFSFNVFNHLTTRLLKEHGVVQATVSPEAAIEQVCTLAANSELPLEIIAHGPLEAMILDHHILKAAMPTAEEDSFTETRYSLLDTAGEQHPIILDQFGRNHILFAKDLCLLPFLGKLNGLVQIRIEGQHYTAGQVGAVTRLYRQELDKAAVQAEAYTPSTAVLTELAAQSPRELGIGAFRYRASR